MRFLGLWNCTSSRAACWVKSIAPPKSHVWILALNSTPLGRFLSYIARKLSLQISSASPARICALSNLSDFGLPGPVAFFAVYWTKLSFNNRSKQRQALWDEMRRKRGRFVRRR